MGEVRFRILTLQNHEPIWILFQILSLRSANGADVQNLIWIDSAVMGLRVREERVSVWILKN